jgi:cell division protein FtsI/penicillin-binding protein 2
MYVPRAAAVIVVGSLVLAACTGGDQSSGASPAALSAGVIAEFTGAWVAGHPAAMGRATDDPHDASAVSSAAIDELESQRTLIDPLGSVVCRTDAACTQRQLVTMSIRGIGLWRYETSIEARLVSAGAGSGEWLVHWTPSVLHPRLTPDTEFDRTRELPDRASILDRNGNPLTQNLPIVDIGVVPAKVEPASYPALRQLLDIDVASLRASVHAADPNSFVEIYPMRRPEYDDIRGQLLKVPGILINTGLMSLAPTSGWARAVLGKVSDATPETLKAAGPLAESTDLIGDSGLQLAYQQQLAGRPGGSVDLVDSKSGRLVRTLWRVRPVLGEPLVTTLDYEIQQAAEDALAGQTKTTALVAVQANTGKILAVANGPEVTADNLAFTGELPPGSTFKVVSVAALIQAGVVAPTDRVSCPDTIVVGGKRFRNYESGIVGPGSTLVDAFAASCNTTVVGFADRLDDRALPRAAAEFGIGASWDLGLDAYSGSVPTPTDLVDRAATMIGQGRVLMSPLAMAMVAAAVDAGQPFKPELVPARHAGGPSAGGLPDSLDADLKTMMRAVVTEGTGSALDLPGLPVYAKTGTAEYGPTGATRTHAWMIGFRGNLAFAVFVQGGESGAHDAAPVVADFLTALPAAAYH